MADIRSLPNKLTGHTVDILTRVVTLTPVRGSAMVTKCDSGSFPVFPLTPWTAMDFPDRATWGISAGCIRVLDALESTKNYTNLSSTNKST